MLGRRKEPRRHLIQTLCAKGVFILTFFKILIFGASIQLTSSPIDIGTTPLKLKAPQVLSVVTSGAHLLIDIRKNVKNSGLFEARNGTKIKYPESCIKAKMITNNNKVYIFESQGVLWTKGTVQVTLSSTVKLESDLEFTRVEISSCKLIKGAEVTWVNYKY